MIRNISIALLSALMAYLLSSTENNMNAFALVVSALAFTLGYIAANESRKQTERTETAMRSLKESIDTQNEALKSSLTDFGKQTTNAITTLKSSFDDLKNVAVKFYSSTEEILVKMSESLISANNKLSDIARVTINSEGSGSKVEDAIREMKGEITKVASPLPDRLDDLKEVIKRLQESADEIPKKIESALNNMEQNLSDSYENANSEGREEIKKGMDNIMSDFNKAIGEFSDIAIKFTDYEKEKDIIQRLEKLCK